MAGTDQSPVRLFGTDGIRGAAGRFPLDGPTIRRIGAALVRALPSGGRSRLLVGRDTRESGVWIEAEFAHGAASEGASVASVGVAPTPAVAYLARETGYDAGVVISASHNPFDDNGIKIFSGRGEKFTERVEREVEAIVADDTWRVSSGVSGQVPSVDLLPRYLAHLRDIVGDRSSIGGLSLAVDCANGATTSAAPALFAELGVATVLVGIEPNGRNINLDCGSTHPERLAQAVVERGCDLGVAFDGDGDRAIFVDHHGAVVNGDAVLLMCSRQLQREGRLRGQAVVATVMSNIGLELALRDSGIDLVRCPVGDKYVMEELISRDLALGGEQSGHIIFSDYLFTGDGLCTALQVLRTMAATQRRLADLAAELVAYPQVLVNVRVAERRDLSSLPAVTEAIARVEKRLAGNGRLLVRYSGTEPLLRVMLEGQREDEIHEWAEEIATAVRDTIGESGD